MGAIVRITSYQSPLKSHSFHREAGDTAAFITLVPSIWGLTHACLVKCAAAVCIFFLYWDVLLSSAPVIREQRCCCDNQLSEQSGTVMSVFLMAGGEIKTRCRQCRKGTQVIHSQNIGISLLCNTHKYTSQILTAVM